MSMSVERSCCAALAVAVLTAGCAKTGAARSNVQLNAAKIEHDIQQELVAYRKTCCYWAKLRRELGLKQAGKLGAEKQYRLLLDKMLTLAVEQHRSLLERCEILNRKLTEEGAGFSARPNESPLSGVD